MQINNKKAFGLLEALVAIAVFGMAIVLGLNLVVQSLKIIKDNQISDEATTFMVSTLEYVKSPNLDSAIISPGFYSLIYNGSFTGLTSQAIELEKDNCSASSPYAVEVSPDNPLVVCTSIKVELVDSSNPNSDFLITSKVVYEVSDEFLVREIRGFKQKSI